jgi:hypothetical protein
VQTGTQNGVGLGIPLIGLFVGADVGVEVNPGAEVGFGVEVCPGADVNFGVEVGLGVEVGPGAEVGFGVEVCPGAEVGFGVEVCPTGVGVGDGVGVGEKFGHCGKDKILEYGNNFSLDPFCPSHSVVIYIEQITIFGYSPLTDGPIGLVSLVFKASFGYVAAGRSVKLRYSEYFVKELPTSPVSLL